jgi:hypothetical protein
VVRTMRKAIHTKTINLKTPWAKRRFCPLQFIIAHNDFGLTATGQNTKAYSRAFPFVINVFKLGAFIHFGGYCPL